MAGGWQHRRGGATPTSTQGESSRTKGLRHALAKAHPGSFWWKMHGSEFVVRGLPDLFGCVDGYLYAIEVKIGTNWFSASQVARLRELHRAGACAGGVVLPKEKTGEAWWVPVTSMGHKGDHRRNTWVPFKPTDLIFFRSELSSGTPSDP